MRRYVVLKHERLLLDPRHAATYPVIKAVSTHSLARDAHRAAKAVGGWVA